MVKVVVDMVDEMPCHFEPLQACRVKAPAVQDDGSQGFGCLCFLAVTVEIESHQAFGEKQKQSEKGWLDEYAVAAEMYVCLFVQKRRYNQTW